MQLLVQNCLDPSRATEIFSVPKRRIFALPKIVRYWNKSGLGVISKVRTSRTNERTFIWHFTPSLPPQTKVWSTINGSIVWQMAMHIILILPNNLPKQCRRSHAGTLPLRFSVHALIAKWTKEKSQTVEISTISTFVSVSACWKAGGHGRCRSTVSNWRECLLLPV